MTSPGVASHARAIDRRGGPPSHLQLAEVAAKGVEVSADKAVLLAWLHHPNTALAHHTPLNLLSSRFGAEIVLEENTFAPRRWQCAP